MSIVTIRLPSKLLQDADCHAKLAHMARSEYIRIAIEQMNHEMRKKERAIKLKKASLRVRKESMAANKEFQGIEHDIED